MTDAVTGEERKYLATLLERRHKELIHELHHAATAAYKAGLKEEIALTETLQRKVTDVK